MNEMLGHVRSNSRWIFRGLLLAGALALAAASIDAQGRAVATPALGLVRQTRMALGHGDLAGAKTIAENSQGDAAAHNLGRALVALYEGRDADARTLLTPLAAAAPMGDASLELGLLDLRTGHRDEGTARLDRLDSVRTFVSPDDYFRLARAARGAREFLLANDAYQRVANEARADIQTEWGDVFLERHQANEALTNYRQALAIDPKWIRAMLGIVRAEDALEDGDADAAEQAFDAAKKQAPDDPDVVLLGAQRAFGDDDIAGAKAALDRLSTLRPHTVDEAALRVAITYKASGASAVDAAAAAVQAIDPRSAAGYTAASEQATHSYRFDEAVAFGRKATTIDPDDAVAFFDLGMAQTRTGDEAGARTALQRAWDLDKSDPTTKNLLTLLDDLDTFVVIPHNNFIFKFDKSQADVMKLYALPLADEAYRQYVERYGFTPKGPILVEVFVKHDDFAVRTLGLPGLLGALGACFGTVVAMDSPTARKPGDFSWQATLWHELAHVFTLQLSNYRVPRWLTEGMSAYEEHRRYPAWGRELTLEFASQLGKGKTFGVKKLPEAFKDPETLALGYFEASLVVEHLVDLKGYEGLRTLLLAYAGGASDAEAFSKAFGETIDQVDASFNAFIDQQYGPLRDAMKDPPKDVEDNDLAGLKARASQAPGNFESQIAYGQQLVRTGDLAAARAPLERAAALAPQATGDGSPHGVLALIDEKDNDNAGAIREWRALLAWDHTNVDAARHLVTTARAAHDADAEQFALQRVVDLDPFDAEAHVNLGRLLIAKGQPAPALVEFQANLALGPANLAEAHTDAADALLKLGRKDEAKREALSALEIAPTFARAQDVLLDATGK